MLGALRALLGQLSGAALVAAPDMRRRSLKGPLCVDNRLYSAKFLTAKKRRKPVTFEMSAKLNTGIMLVTELSASAPKAKTPASLNLFISWQALAAPSGTRPKQAQKWASSAAGAAAARPEAAPRSLIGSSTRSRRRRAAPKPQQYKERPAASASRTKVH